MPHFSCCQSLDTIPSHFLINISSLTKPIITFPPRFSTRRFLFYLLLLCGDVETNPGPDSVNYLKCAHLNVRSASTINKKINKPTLICELISDYKLDILTLSETWFTENTLPSILNSFIPNGYSILHTPRPYEKSGGGVAVIYRSFLKASIIQTHTCLSFETIGLKFTIANSNFNLYTIYRPPSSSNALFLNEFSTMLEDIISHPSEIIFFGDFNIHVDTPTSYNTAPFLNLLDTYHLSQHIHFPTHIHGHTLDLLITRSESNITSNISEFDPCISDHHAITFNLNVPSHRRPSQTTKLVRSFKSINITNFSNDILSSDLHTVTPTSLNSYVDLFSSTLSNILNKHAPLKSITISNRPQKPFITPEIKNEKGLRSRLESIWRANKTSFNHSIYKTQARKVAKLITDSKKLYFQKFVSQNQNNPKKLWAGLDSLLSRKPSSILPTFSCSHTMASTFSDFFIDKINKISSKFVPNINTSLTEPSPTIIPPQLNLFTAATSDEITHAISKTSDASCSLDPIPTYLLKSCLPALIQPITNIVNLSLSEGAFPDSYKNAIVKPLYKKHSLPHEDLSSYRPISNLNFISKIIERIIHTRISNHLKTFPSLSPFQSAYRPFHSTETALLRIQNDLLLAMDNRKVSALILLDLSAAFDTIDHSILLSRLSSYFGISGLALKLLTSYLQNRTQTVCINSHLSSPSLLSTGIPQGSVLGPMLFTLYTTPLSYILQKSGAFFHFYADDTQLYISFPPALSHKPLSVLSSTLDLVHTWFTNNRLCLNPSKTEYLVIGTRCQRSKLSTTALSISGNIIEPVKSARNLGIIFDSELSLCKHISSICQTSFYHIRQLRQIRSSIDINSATILANALIHSKLDYCNSLYYSLPNSTIHRLQLVQNSLARVVIPSTLRYHHITPVLKRLHWLPVEQRIKFKIASLTYKSLHHQQPSYLFDLLSPVAQSGRRSSSNKLLNLQRVATISGQRSFFSSAPKIWNYLPTALRLSPTYSSFRSKLKTFLFPP